MIPASRARRTSWTSWSTGCDVDRTAQAVTPATPPRRMVVVAGLGSEYRCDDGVGLVVAHRVAEIAAAAIDVGPIEDPLDLLGRWDGASLAVVVDAVQTGAEPGTVHTIELRANGDGEVPPPGGEPRGEPAVSTHGIGMLGVLRLAEATNSAPERVVVVGVEGQDFGRGQNMTAAVESAVPLAVDMVIGLIGEHARCV